jgi:hypothetical protein
MIESSSNWTPRRIRIELCLAEKTIAKKPAVPERIRPDIGITAFSMTEAARMAATTKEFVRMK